MQVSKCLVFDRKIKNSDDCFKGDFILFEKQTLG